MRERLRRLTVRIVVLAMLAIGLALAVAGPAQAAVVDKRKDHNRDGVSDMVAIISDDYCLYRWYGNGSGDAVVLPTHLWRWYGDGQGDVGGMVRLGGPGAAEMTQCEPVACRCVLV